MASNDGADILLRGYPTLEELLSDDVTRAVMRADHVGVPEVRGLCMAVGVRLEQRSAWHRRLAGRPATA